MPLLIAPQNVELRIVKILVEERLKKHLESLGITINSTLKIIANQGGNLIVMVKEGRLAIDKGIATKILVA